MQGLTPTRKTKNLGNLKCGKLQICELKIREVEIWADLPDLESHADVEDDHDDHGDDEEEQR